MTSGRGTKACGYISTACEFTRWPLSSHSSVPLHAGASQMGLGQQPNPDLQKAAGLRSLSWSPSSTQKPFPSVSYRLVNPALLFWGSECCHYMRVSQFSFHRVLTIPSVMPTIFPFKPGEGPLSCAQFPCRASFQPHLSVTPHQPHHSHSFCVGLPYHKVSLAVLGWTGSQHVSSVQQERTDCDTQHNLLRTPGPRPQTSTPQRRE